VLRLVNGMRSFLEILQACSGDSAAAAKTLYALYTLGLIRKKQTSVKIVAGLGLNGGGDS